ncbi:MAG: helix-turn-helix domain-containing protein [Anaerolineales bacterium]|nr:helix-turn-helix domain-containing protein [Anaerolineales bacterium]
MDYQLAITILSKKMGVLLRTARTQRGKSKKSCAEVIGTTSRTITKYEAGEKSPSLPELEVLAYYLDVPLDRFWEDMAPVDQDKMMALKNLEQRMEIRNLKIGASLRKFRQDSKLSMKEVSEKIGLTTYRLKSYEKGKFAVPVAELNALLRLFDKELGELVVDSGPIAEWVHAKKAGAAFIELPRDLQDFVLKPINRPYLEIAQKLSHMSVDQMRDVAERLLDITL